MLPNPYLVETTQFQEEPLPGRDLDEPDETPRLALVIDDDEEYLNLTKLMLRRAGFNVISATNCELALQKCGQHTPDVILLDLMMPGTDGWQTCQYLREVTAAPILMISAKSDREAAIHSLEVGADDFLSKPVHHHELLARIDSVLRRMPEQNRPKGYSFPKINLHIDLETHEVRLGDQIYYLAPREFSLLVTLAAHAPHPTTYEELEKAIWEAQTPPDSHTCIKNLVFMLRHKLENDPARPAFIMNFRGVGYYLQTHAHPSN